MSDAFSDVAKITADWIDELAHYANSNDLCTDVSTILGRGQEDRDRRSAPRRRVAAHGRRASMFEDRYQNIPAGGARKDDACLTR
ncbi:hypothetical protein [Mycobacterium sp.]|uniref:hypothetical protein n=1 Tax=Mycobacterium sp. TaxID=1785 RepID=UPI003C78DF1B